MFSSIPWPIHYYKYTDKAYCATNNVIFIWGSFVYLPPTKYGHDDENATIGRINPAKISGLKGWDYSVEHQDYSTQYTYPYTLAFPNPKPYKIPTTNLT
jgi:hypothetical protein